MIEKVLIFLSFPATRTGDVKQSIYTSIKMMLSGAPGWLRVVSLSPTLVHLLKKIKIKLFKKINLKSNCSLP